ncbi:hypothetical protein HK101_011056, partial [Irineochytrium annulatum]
MSIQNFMKGVKISECLWLSDRKADPKNRHVAPSETAKKESLLRELIFWVVDSLVIPLISTNFYVTETARTRNRVAYFRHDDWLALAAPTFDRLTRSTFEPAGNVSKEQREQRKLGCSVIRLLPKEYGARPIANLRRRPRAKYKGGPPVRAVVQQPKAPLQQVKAPPPPKGGISVNSMLINAFQVLKFENGGVTRRVGVRALEHVPKASELQREDGGPYKQPFYFVKVDIKQCYDSIKQKLLMSILQNLLKEDEYMIRKYSIVFSQTGKIRRKFMRNAGIPSEFEQFAAFAEGIAGKFKNTIFTDQIGKRTYHQIEGIPQGSILSAILCSIFYTRMEENELPKFFTDNSLLMRLVDDFLYITTDRELAVGFLTKMLIDLRDTLTVDISVHPWANLRRKAMEFLQPKSSTIYYDTNFNSEGAVIFNIYQNFTLCAMKFFLHLKEVSNAIGRADDGFILSGSHVVARHIPYLRHYIQGCISDAISYGYMLIHSRMRGKTAIPGKSAFALAFPEVS